MVGMFGGQSAFGAAWTARTGFLGAATVVPYPKSRLGQPVQAQAAAQPTAPAVTPERSRALVVGRLCELLTPEGHFEIQNWERKFWEMAEAAGISEAEVASEVGSRCPGLEIPARPPGMVRREIQAGREQRRARRLCAILTKFTESGVPEDVKSMIFWSYVRHWGMPETDVNVIVQAGCPGIPVPPPAPLPAPEPPPAPGQGGFRGKATISLAEARELLALLDEVLRPLTPEEAAASIGREECLRQLAVAGGFPLVEGLRERLAAFVSAGVPGSTFEISHGELTVTQKAVDCAVAIGRGRTIRTALTAGGIAAGGALLLLLL